MVGPLLEILLTKIASYLALVPLYGSRHVQAQANVNVLELFCVARCEFQHASYYKPNAICL